GGRITRKDIEEVIAQGNIPKENETSNVPNGIKSEPQSEYKVQTTPSSSLHLTAQTGDIEIPVKGVRKVIADNMVKSKTDIPHAWTTVEADVTDLVTYRNQVKNDFKQKAGINLTFFAFLVKAVSQALKEYPQLNSM